MIADQTGGKQYDPCREQPCRAFRNLIAQCDDLTGQNIPFELTSLTRQIEERDFRDRNRAASPLIQALDATYLDSSHLSSTEVEDAILKVIRAKTSNGKELAH